MSFGISQPTVGFPGLDTEPAPGVGAEGSGVDVANDLLDGRAELAGSESLSRAARTSAGTSDPCAQPSTQLKPSDAKHNNNGERTLRDFLKAFHRGWDLCDKAYHAEGARPFSPLRRVPFCSPAGTTATDFRVPVRKARSCPRFSASTGAECTLVRGHRSTAKTQEKAGICRSPCGKASGSSTSCPDVSLLRPPTPATTAAWRPSSYTRR
jgi:hypothetical protein